MAASPAKQDTQEDGSAEEKKPAKEASKSESESPPTSTSSEDAETIKVPQMAESISEGTLKTWMKKVGDRVEADEEIASIETDKVCIASRSRHESALTHSTRVCQIDVTINAPKAGIIVEILAKEEETVSVGQDLYKLASSDGGSESDGLAHSIVLTFKAICSFKWR